MIYLFCSFVCICARPIVLPFISFQKADPKASDSVARSVTSAYREDKGGSFRTGRPGGGGPLGKFRPLRDDDTLPVAASPDAPAARTKRLFIERKAREAAQAEAHLRVPSRRWTFVIKDTSQWAVK